MGPYHKEGIPLFLTAHPLCASMKVLDILALKRMVSSNTRLIPHNCSQKLIYTEHSFTLWFANAARCLLMSRRF